MVNLVKGIFIFLFLVLALAFIMPHAYAYDENAVTKKFDFTLKDGQVTQVAQDQLGTKVCGGTSNGNVTCYDQTGIFLWRATFDSSIKKLVISPANSRYLIQTWGNYVYYGDTSDGTIYASYYGPGLYWFGIKGWNVTDIDISRDGAYWGFTTSRHTIIKDSTNTTIVYRELDQDATGSYAATGNYSLFHIDPDKQFFVVSYDMSTSISEYSIDVSSGWYQGYLWRKSFVITGSSDGWLNNYPVNITIYNTTGTSTGSTVYIGANRTQLDWDDIRFTQSDGTTRVNQWYRQQWSDRAIYSVVYPNLTQSGSHTLYLYYGNTSAAQYSNSSTSLMKSTDYTGGFSWDQYSSTTNASFDMEQDTAWNCTTWLGYPSSPSYCGYTTRNTNWSYSRRAYSYISSCGSINTAWTETNQTFNLYPNPNGSAYAWNVSFDAEPYYSRIETGTGGGHTASSGYSLYVNDTLLYARTVLSGSFDATAYGTWTNFSFRTPAGPLKIGLRADTYAFGAPGDCMEAWQYSGIDHMLLNATWSLSSTPSAGSWGAAENIFRSTLKDTYNAGETPLLMDMPWNSPWLVMSSASNVYQIQIDATGFGVSYTYPTSTTGTPYALAESDAGSYFVEGRGFTVDLFRLGATKTGIFYAGQPITSASISTTNGEWVVVGSNDGHTYIYSKAGQSTWYVYWISASGSVPNDVTVDSLGALVCSGHANGNLTCWATTPVPVTPAGSFYITVHVLKDAAPYITNCSLSNGEYTGDVWAFVRTDRTDTRGNFVFEAFPTKFYKVRCGTEGVESIIYATNTLTDYYISIKTPMVSSTVSFSAAYASNTNTIDMVYNDAALDTNSVTFRIIDVGNYTEVYNTTFYSNSVAQSWPVPSGYSDRTYKVDCQVNRGAGTLHNMWMVRPSGTMSTQLPIDTNMSNAICVIFLMVLSGLFGRVHSARGAIIVVGFFAFFIYLGWMTVPWWAAAPIIVIAFLYGLVKAAPQ